MKTPGLTGVRCGPSGAAFGPAHESGSAGVVRPSEGNEARPDGRQGVGASHSTDEAGESSPRRPCGGKGMPEHGLVGRTHHERTEVRYGVNETPANSDAGPAGAADTCGRCWTRGYGMGCCARHPVVNPCSEEPDAGIPHVRICEGPGRAIAPAYSTTFRTRASSALGSPPTALPSRPLPGIPG